MSNVFNYTFFLPNVFVTFFADEREDNSALLNIGALASVCRAFATACNDIEVVRAYADAVARRVVKRGFRTGDHALAQQQSYQMMATYHAHSMMYPYMWRRLDILYRIAYEMPPEHFTPPVINLMPGVVTRLADDNRLDHRAQQYTDMFWNIDAVHLGPLTDPVFMSDGTRERMYGLVESSVRGRFADKPSRLLVYWLARAPRAHVVYVGTLLFIQRLSWGGAQGLTHDYIFTLLRAMEPHLPDILASVHARMGDSPDLMPTMFLYVQYFLNARRSHSHLTCKMIAAYFSFVRQQRNTTQLQVFHLRDPIEIADYNMLQCVLRADSSFDFPFDLRQCPHIASFVAYKNMMVRESENYGHKPLLSTRVHAFWRSQPCSECGEKAVDIAQAVATHTWYTPPLVLRERALPPSPSFSLARRKKRGRPKRSAAPPAGPVRQMVLRRRLRKIVYPS